MSIINVGYWLLGFYVLVKSGQVPTCDNAHSWWFYSATPLGDQTTSTITWYPIQTHYPDTEPTSPCPILINYNADTWLGKGKDRFLSHWFDSTMVRIPRSFKTDAQLNWSVCIINTSTDRMNNGNTKHQFDLLLFYILATSQVIFG